MLEYALAVTSVKATTRAFQALLKPAAAALEKCAPLSTFELSKVSDTLLAGVACRRQGQLHTRFFDLLYYALNVMFFKASTMF